MYRQNKVILLLVSLAALSGCGSENIGGERLANRANARIKENETRVYQNGEPYKADDLTHDGEEFEYSTAKTKERAERIARAVTALEGIEKASVVITGNSAIIGIEIQGELTDASLKQYKHDAEAEARKAEKSIDHVAVTAGPEMISKIKNVADFISGEDEPPVPQSEEQENLINGLTPAL